MCISISVLVPSGNSSMCVGVEHCISKLQAVKEFIEIDSTLVDNMWSSSHGFTQYPFLQFDNCIEFISKTSSVSLLLTMRCEL